MRNKWLSGPANTRWKISYCSGSVSWNSSISAARYCRRSTAASAGAAAAGKRGVHAGQQVVEELDLQLVLPARQLLLDVAQGLELHADDVVLHRPGQLVAQIEEAMLRRRELGLLGDLLRDGGAAEDLQGVQCGWGKLRGAEATLNLAERLGHQLVVVVRLVRPLGAAAEVAADSVLLLAPDFPQGIEHGFQVRGQRRCVLAVHGRKQLEERVRQAAPHQRQQGLGAQAVLQGKDDGDLARAVELPAPVILDDLAQQRHLVRHQLGVEQAAGLERPVLEHPLAEAVDGVDGRLIKAVERAIQPRRQIRPLARVLLHQRAQERVVAGARGERLQGIGQRLADAMAQFLRRRHRVGHHQDFADRQVLLQDEPQEETGDGEGLAGAGAGLDQGGSLPQAPSRPTGRPARASWRHLLQHAQQRPEDRARGLLEFLVQGIRAPEAQIEVSVFAFTRHLGKGVAFPTEPGDAGRVLLRLAGLLFQRGLGVGPGGLREELERPGQALPVEIEQAGQYLRRVVQRRDARSTCSRPTSTAPGHLPSGEHGIQNQVLESKTARGPSP